MTITPNKRKAGFTLLEVLLAVSLMVMLIGMVAIASKSTLSLGQTVVETQNQEMLHQAFFELLGKRFASLPGNTRFDLKVQDSGGQYISDLTLQNVPLSFTWGGQPRVAKAVQISTVRRRTGFLSIVLRYYENEILEDSAATTGTSQLDTEPFAEIELLSDVAYFEWNILDGRSMEWQYDWDLQGRLPLQLELRMSFGAHSGEIRHIFWISPKQNPEVVLRQNLQNQTGQGTTTTPGTGGSGGGGTGGTGGNRGGGQGGGNINIPVGPVQGGGGSPRSGR